MIEWLLIIAGVCFMILCVKAGNRSGSYLGHGLTQHQQLPPPTPPLDVTTTQGGGLRP